MVPSKVSVQKPKSASQTNKRRTAMTSRASSTTSTTKKSTGTSTSPSGKTTNVFPEDARCFNPVRRETGVFHVLDPQYTKEQRKQICRHLPEIMNSSWLLTAKELSDCGWQEMKSGERHYKECDQDSYPFGMFAGPEYIQKLGLMPQMTRLQEIVTDPGFQAFLVKHQRWGKKNSGAYNMVASIQYPPSKTTTRIQLSQNARARNPLAEEHNRLCSQVAAAVLDDFYSREIKDVLVRRSKIQAAMSCGAHYNPYTNQIQINLSPVDGSKLSQSIGDVGCTHVDSHDDPTRHTVVLSLGNISKQAFPGRFNMLALKLTCTMAPFSALVLPGVDAHLGTGVGPYPADLPLDSPRRYRYPEGFILPKLPEGVPPIRANTVVYPNKVLAENDHKIHEEFNESVGLAQFLDHESHAEWKVQAYVKKLLTNPQPGLVKPSADEIVQMFPWKDEKGDTKFPDKSMAEDCLSYNRQSDPAFEKILAITKKTATGLPKIRQEKDDAGKEKARQKYVRRKEKEKAKREGTVLPPTRVVKPGIKKVVKKGRAKASEKGAITKVTKDAVSIEQPVKKTVSKRVFLTWHSKTIREFTVDVEIDSSGLPVVHSSPVILVSKDLTIWTHKGQVSSFDPEIDTIPGNQ